MKSSKAEQIHEWQAAAQELSGQTLAPELEVSMEIVASETIPWAGVDDFYANQASKHAYSTNTYRDDDQNDEQKSEATSASDEAPHWALSFACFRVKVGSVTLHNDDEDQTCRTLL